MTPGYFDRAVVCNTGPFVGLTRAGLVGLLSQIFPAVLVPEAVAAELSLP